jgi:hypothetical protein
MALEERDSKSFAEILAEKTGRDISEFEPPGDFEMPNPADLEIHNADEFYSDE